LISGRNKTIVSEEISPTQANIDKAVGLFCMLHLCPFTALNQVLIQSAALAM
jgi:hypothetical protein